MVNQMSSSHAPPRKVRVAVRVRKFRIYLVRRWKAWPSKGILDQLRSLGDGGGAAQEEKKLNTLQRGGVHGSRAASTQILTPHPSTEFRAHVIRGGGASSKGSRIFPASSWVSRPWPLMGSQWSPRTWSRIPVALYTKSQFVQFCLKQSKQADLYLNFFLVPLTSLAKRYPGPTAKDVVDTLFPLLNGDSLRIRDLSISCQDPSAYTSVMTWVSRIKVQRLDKLSLVLAPPPQTSITHGGSPFSHKLPLQAPNLRALQLSLSVPQWNISILYTRITMLKLMVFRMDYSMSRITISWVLSTIPNLELLHLFEVECDDIYPDDIYSEDPDIWILPRLTDLILSFSHQSSALIVSHLHLPVLTRLRLDIRALIMEYGQLPDR
ncbi:hypothetical protein C8R44DRAFT_744648 [Mycena epipterygia]|nr:hypothetical protein C8R44DRAFT_744648 [Mycena epipterygia]